MAERRRVREALRRSLGAAVFSGSPVAEQIVNTLHEQDGESTSGGAAIRSAIDAVRSIRGSDAGESTRAERAVSATDRALEGVVQEALKDWAIDRQKLANQAHDNKDHESLLKSITSQIRPPQQWDEALKLLGVLKVLKQALGEDGFAEAVPNAESLESQANLIAAEHGGVILDIVEALRDFRLTAASLKSLGDVVSHLGDDAPLAEKHLRELSTELDAWINRVRGELHAGSEAGNPTSKPALVPAERIEELLEQLSGLGIPQHERTGSNTAPSGT